MARPRINGTGEVLYIPAPLVGHVKKLIASYKDSQQAAILQVVADAEMSTDAIAS